MNKDEIIEIIKLLRKEAEKLVEKYDNHNIHISISFPSTEGEIMDVNPYCLDLRTGIFFGRDLIDGKYKKVKFWEKRLKKG